MNAQIIEDSLSKIVIKCFAIEELSIEECFKRMYFLTLNIFDEILARTTNPSVREIRETTTRFYYLLVLQVRRYLDEGKFSKENQIPLIRALDSRMAAEKLQRINELLSTINNLPPNLMPVFSVIRDYFSRTGLSFINNDYEKSRNLWIEGKSRLKKIHILREQNLKTKNTLLHEHILNLQDTLRYSREISMLVR